MRVHKSIYLSIYLSPAPGMDNGRERDPTANVQRPAQPATRPRRCQITRRRRPPHPRSHATCTSEQQLSQSATLPEHEVAVGYDGDDDEDELIILPKDKSSKVSALGLERPGDG